MRALSKTWGRVLLALAAAAALLVPSGALAGGKPKGKTLVGQVNLNAATAEELQLLPGVGPARAEKIVEARSKRPFKQHKQRLKVDGATTLAWVDETQAGAEAPAATSANRSAKAP